jgi:hypothetical protein
MDERHAQTDLDELGRWLTSERRRIEKQVTVREARRARGPNTTVSIDHRFPCRLDAHAGWHVRTRPAYLPFAHFSSEVRARIKGAENMGPRGRTIYCHDLGLEQVTSVLGYHLAVRPHLPVLITTLGLRRDREMTVALRDRSLAGALVLKHHLHAIADRAGRGGHVDLDLNDSRQLELARRLGFRKAPRMKGFRPAGTHLRQPAPR